MLSIFTVWMGESLSPQNSLALMFFTTLSFLLLTLTMRLTSMLVLGLMAIKSRPLTSLFSTTTGFLSGMVLSTFETK